MREIQVTQYEANDGTVFTNKAMCERYERDCGTLAPILARLGTRRPDANGGEYVQHDGITGDYLFASIKSLPGAPQYVRDCENPWHRAFYRAMCIDSRGREWGQPYFVSHPNHKAVEVK